MFGIAQTTSGRRRSLLYLGDSHPGASPQILLGEAMSLGTLLLIVLVLLLVGVIPSWPHSRSWGYMPSSVLGIVLIIVLILLVTGRL